VLGLFLYIRLSFNPSSAKGYYMSANKNDKIDNKPALEFVHPDFVLGVGNAMTAGAMKYDSWNFLKGHGRLQLCSAILRHTYAIMKGELIDAELTERLGRTVYHYDCIGANINMMIWQLEYGTSIEDKPAGKKSRIKFNGKTKAELEARAKELIENAYIIGSD
jgi:uncharacterized protein YuzB (UPF0349 family)